MALRGRAAPVAVIAGGLGSRLGGRKPTVSLAGRPLVAHPVNAARAAGLEVFLVAKPETPLPELGVRVLVEPEEPRHPLAGVVFALRSLRGPVVACAGDMPFVPPALLRELAEAEAPAAAVGPGGRLEPLLARFDQDALAELELAIAEGLPASRAVAGLSPVPVGTAELSRHGDPATILFNVNDRGDLERAEAMLASGAARLS